jgi:glycosyltransferase involved in cell wall biosynthesis
MGLSALVVTVVHHPDDSRIRHRQITALLEAGWRITYAAPFAGYGVAMPAGLPGLTTVDIPRAWGRHRLGAVRAARRLLRTRTREHDVVLLHDPELLLALPGLDLPPVVWDVHEDTPAATSTKPWLPRVLRGPTAAVVRAVERLAASRVHLILAEHSYVYRFGAGPLVVPNTVRVPEGILPPGDRHVVYLGHVTIARGGQELTAVGRRLAEATGGRTRLLVIGAADNDAQRLLRQAAEQGHLEWTGYVRSGQALRMLDGALAGLSLLHDEGNYRGSLPTKVIEYMAHGVPVITTPLPLAADLVRRAGCGFVVPFADPDAAVQEILSLRSDPAQRTAMGAAGHRVARAEFDWGRRSLEFVDELATIATRTRGSKSLR